MDSQWLLWWCTANDGKVVFSAGDLITIPPNAFQDDQNVIVDRDVEVLLTHRCEEVLKQSNFRDGQLRDAGSEYFAIALEWLKTH